MNRAASRRRREAALLAHYAPTFAAEKKTIPTTASFEPGSSTAAAANSPGAASQGSPATSPLAGGASASRYQQPKLSRTATTSGAGCVKKAIGHSPSAFRSKGIGGSRCDMNLKRTPQLHGVTTESSPGIATSGAESAGGNHPIHHVTSSGRLATPKVSDSASGSNAQLRGTHFRSRVRSPEGVLFGQHDNGGVGTHRNPQHSRSTPSVAAMTVGAGASRHLWSAEDVVNRLHHSHQYRHQPNLVYHRFQGRGGRPMPKSSASSDVPPYMLDEDCLEGPAIRAETEPAESAGNVLPRAATDVSFDDVRLVPAIGNRHLLCKGPWRSLKPSEYRKLIHQIEMTYFHDSTGIIVKNLNGSFHQPNHLSPRQEEAAAIKIQQQTVDSDEMQGPDFVHDEGIDGDQSSHHRDDIEQPPIACRKSANVNNARTTLTFPSHFQPCPNPPPGEPKLYYFYSATDTGRRRAGGAKGGSSYIGASLSRALAVPVFSGLMPLLKQTTTWSGFCCTTFRFGYFNSVP